MHNQRKKRYRQKFELISERIKNINEWLVEVSLNEFMMDIKTKLATFKALQEIIEASMDILAMLIVDMQLCVEDDYANIEKLHQKKVINNDIASFLKKANGIRNRIIHEYNAISEPIIWDFINKEIYKFKEIIKIIQPWIEKL
jgi:uncharacterized protein YutE (UPF0331/DUF86 family)